MATMTVLVAGVDVTERYTNGSLHWEDQLEGRGQLSIEFCDVVGGFRPEDGQEILVLEDGVRRFGGMLVEPEEHASPGNDLLFFSCTAVEFSAICDRHLVARAYTEQTLQDIVLDIVAQDLADEGIDTSGVEEGTVIKKAVFNWVTATEAFNQLAELTGMAWRIDEYRVLHFRERSSIAAPADLTNTRIRNGSLRIRPDRQQYRNHQVLRASTGLTDPRTESFVGDGERRTFNVAFKVGTVPTIAVNGVAKTVGIRQVDSGKDWYWNKGATELSQDDGGTVLTASDTLEVTYRGQFPIIISATRSGEIAARQAIEGGSGRYSRVEERPNIDTVDAAIQAAQALLNRYGTIGHRLTCYTDQPGYAPGQLVRCTFAQHGIDDDYLIESITADIAPGGAGIWYALTCISGDPYGGWQQYFRRVLQLGRQNVIGENEVVVGLQEFADAASATEELSQDADYPAFRVGAARVGFSVVRAA